MKRFKTFRVYDFLWRHRSESLLWWVRIKKVKKGKRAKDNCKTDNKSSLSWLAFHLVQRLKFPLRTILEQIGTEIYPAKKKCNKTILKSTNFFFGLFNNVSCKTLTHHSFAKFYFILNLSFRVSSKHVKFH